LLFEQSRSLVNSSEEVWTNAPVRTGGGGCFVILRSNRLIKISAVPIDTSTTVCITFETPSDGPSMAGSTHERRIDGVPQSVAEQMVTDFERYRKGRKERSPLYRYEQDGEEVLLALDLDEVVALDRLAS
jgi:hypothetical protein